MEQVGSLPLVRGDGDSGDEGLVCHTTTGMLNLFWVYTALVPSDMFSFSM